MKVCLELEGELLEKLFYRHEKTIEDINEHNEDADGSPWPFMTLSEHIAMVIEMAVEEWETISHDCIMTYDQKAKKWVLDHG